MFMHETAMLCKCGSPIGEFARLLHPERVNYRCKWCGGRGWYGYDDLGRWSGAPVQLGHDQQNQPDQDQDKADGRVDEQGDDAEHDEKQS